LSILIIIGSELPSHQSSADERPCKHWPPVS
jgi:hypothetical protein